MKTVGLGKMYRILICISIVLIIYYNLGSINPTISCYDATEGSLEDITRLEVRKDKSIFFIDTTCDSYREGRIIISPRTACALESAARANRKSNVYLLFVSPGIIDPSEEEQAVFQALFMYSNIKIARIYFKKFAERTPVEKIYKYKMYHSKYGVWHSSDILRLLVLRRYGGIYMDTDVISLKSLEPLHLNYIGLESKQGVNGAVLSLSHDGAGREFVDKTLKYLSEHFSGQSWAKNGPTLLTGRLMKQCNVSEPADLMNKSYCRGITLYQPDTFHPIPYGLWEYLFHPNHVDALYSMVENSYTVHLWNFLSGKTKAFMHENNTVTTLAQLFCPFVSERVDFI